MIEVWEEKALSEDDDVWRVRGCADDSTFLLQWMAKRKGLLGVGHADSAAQPTNAIFTFWWIGPISWNGLGSLFMARKPMSHLMAHMDNDSSTSVKRIPAKIREKKFRILTHY